MGKFHGQCEEDFPCRKCGQMCCRYCREGWLCPRCASDQRKESNEAAARLAQAYWPKG
jgi:hypothetical protein